MKFDSKVRKQIAAALDQLAVVQNSHEETDLNVAKAGEILEQIICNQEDWRPENWSMKDY